MNITTSKERLDGVLGMTYPFDDSDIAYEFSKAYPKLRAVVEAAKACASYETGRHELRKALAALEEDV